MSFLDSIRAKSIIARQLSGSKTASPAQKQGGITGWLNSVENGIKHFIQVNFKAAWHGLFIWQILEYNLGRFVVDAIKRIIVDVLNALKHWIERLIWQLYTRLLNMIKANYRKLATMIQRAVIVAEAYAFGLVMRERRYRIAADIRLDHEIKTRIKWLHQQIEREAVSAYRGQRSQQTSVITRLLDLVANLNPILRPLISDVIKGILDLASVDNPVARIALGFLLRQIIDRLGLDKPIGDLIHNLLSNVLGQGKPNDLHAVLADMCSRLAAGETQWTEFYAEGGSEVEQAGSQWQAVTAWTTDAALLGLFATMALEPAAFAKDTTGALAVFVHDTINATKALIEGV